MTDFTPDPAFKTMKVGDKLDLTQVKNGGVIKELFREGVGDEYPTVNDKVVIRYEAYKGEIAPEYLFDSSERDGKDFEYDCCTGKVVRGFDLAVTTMKKGERSAIHLKPDYAFGRGGDPPRIPPNTDIVFVTDLISFEGQDLTVEKDKSILKKTLVRGKGHSCPNEGCMVDIYIKGCYENTTFLEKTVQFPLGEGSDPKFGIPSFVENCLNGIKRGEQCRLQFKSKKAYGNAGCEMYKVPPDTDLEFHIHMNNFERVKELWEMDNKERMDQCEIFKQKGTMYYKRNELELALKFYDKMLDNVEYDLCMEGEEEKRRKQLVVAGNLNKALVCSKQGNQANVKICCDKVLKIDPDNVKGLFRKAQANFATKDYKEAKEAFERVHKLDPTLKAAAHHIKLCDQNMRQLQSEERDLCRNMMSAMGKSVPSQDDRLPDSGMNNITDWDNSMADGMMTLEQEREAFGEPMPVRGGNNHGVEH